MLLLYIFPTLVNLQWRLVPGYLKDEALILGPPCGASVW